MKTDGGCSDAATSQGCLRELERQGTLAQSIERSACHTLASGSGPALQGDEPPVGGVLV